MSDLIPRHVRRRLAALRGGQPAEPAPEAERPAGPRGLALAPPPGLPEGREIGAGEIRCASYRVVPEAVHEALPEWLEQAREKLAGSALDPGRGHTVAYLDLETLALTGAPVFLVGLLHHGQGGWHLHQVLARDYAEEGAVLELARALLEPVECLVSYNGRSFDWPYLADRRRYHRLGPLEAPREHVDLLMTARRLYRGKLPDCSLGTIERHVLGVERWGDVAGAEIPRLYHEAVAEGDLERLAPVLYHNQADLLSLACLAARWREHLPTRPTEERAT